jgi:hypothetical protein
MRPKISHPLTIEINEKTPIVILAGVTTHCKIIQRITKKNARAVPSLNILSHSKISASRLGAQTVLKIERTATGSVAEITEPNNKHTKNGIWSQKSGKRKKRAPAITNAERRSPNTASIPIDLQLASNCL